MKNNKINHNDKNAVRRDRAIPPASEKIATDYEKDNLLNDKNLQAFKSNPIGLFGQWFQQAFQYDVPEPFIMSLATSSAKGIPSVRPVALCNVDSKGFYFSTNKESNKAADLRENPHAAACFYWIKLDRVVRIEGEVIEHDDDALCYNKWPRRSQIAEHSKYASGEPVDGSEELVKDMEDLLERFAKMEVIPQPKTIQPYYISPKRIEFVQMHLAHPSDRISFSQATAGGSWNCVRLAR